MMLLSESYVTLRCCVDKIQKFLMSQDVMQILTTSLMQIKFRNYGIWEKTEERIFVCTNTKKEGNEEIA
jgi:hypothetical protein